MRGPTGISHFAEGQFHPVIHATLKKVTSTKLNEVAVTTTKQAGCKRL